MIWSRELVKQGTRRAAYVLAATVAGVLANPQQALAAVVQAYIMFDVAPSSNVSAVVEKLRSTSLGNCLQLIVGSQARTVVLHLACDEDDRADTRFLSQALVELSRVDGVARATIVSVRRGND
ncbi:MAG: hypothetical protein ACJ8D8_08740 [Microvirga sp.]